MTDTEITALACEYAEEIYLNLSEKSSALERRR